ncbi:hypothetical protein MUP51_04560 [Candidatus Bathyarchaeota archaeon]|nr:hypothetical protein [Candidatus Bathyarchaeota archaeon]
MFKLTKKVLILVVALGFIIVPTSVTSAELKGYYDPQDFDLDLDKGVTCWPAPADFNTTRREAYSVSVYISECYEISPGYPDDEVRVVITRRTDMKTDNYNYVLGPGESTPTILGNGYPLEIHIQWLNGEEGGDLGTKVIGYINWYMN